jgi:hydroxymethylbilane synthase
MRGTVLDLEAMLPAVGQAAIGLECRSGDPAVAAVLRRLNHAATLACVRVERAFLSGFGGGCHSPVAALATVDGDGVRFRAAVYEGERCWRKEVRLPLRGAAAAARRLGREARQVLLAPV